MLLNRVWVLCLLFLGWYPGEAYAGEELKWEVSGGYRVARLPVPKSGKTGFTRQPGEATGIRFTNSLSETRKMANANLLNGSGVGLGDYDGDGLCDIYLCDLGGKNVLYRNLGNWKFQAVTAQAGVACPNQTSTGAVFADLNGDGSLDFLVTSMGAPIPVF
ncbi:MAG: VCBS repeat-containing protein [Pedosphaera sp.]|nr:VCBS repeat-containing protein [Pedosphaera sp.]